MLTLDSIILSISLSFPNASELLENNDELSIYNFCLYIINKYKGSLGSWNGCEIKKLSRKILYNYADRKRKLKFKYFKKLIKENKFKDSKIILAGILYLEPKEIIDLFNY